MFIIQNYSTAVLFCFITMLCWGSWANTQKLAQKTWRFELFYWDYVIGILLFSVLSAFTLGSVGTDGRSFLDDLKQADTGNIFSALVGGIIFNAANILLVAAIAEAGHGGCFSDWYWYCISAWCFIKLFSCRKGVTQHFYFQVLH